MKDDRQLFRDYAQQGDESAFSELVGKHLTFVYAVAYRLVRDHQLAEEVSQNVFCALANHAHEEEFVSLRAWLYAVTRRQSGNAIRQEVRRKHREQRAHDQLTKQQEMNQSSAMDGEIGSAIDEAIASLSEDDQTALLLRFHEEQSFQELGEMLDLPVRTVQKRVYRAVDRLRDRLLRTGVAFTPAMLGTQLFTADAALHPPEHLQAKIVEEALLGREMTVVTSAVSTPTAASVSLSVTLMKVVPILLATALISVPLVVLWKQKVPSAPTTDLSTSVLSSKKQSLGNAIAIDDIEGIYRMPNGERDAAIRKLLVYLQGRDEPAYFTDLFKRWSALDPKRNAQGIVQLFRDVESARGEMLGQLFRIPLDLWWNASQDEALAWVQSLSAKDYAEAYAFEAVVALLAEDDLDAAYQLLCIRPYTRASTYKAVATRLANRPLSESLDWLESLPEDASMLAPSTSDAEIRFEQEAGATKTALIRAALDELFHQDRRAVADWVIDLARDGASDRSTTLLVSLASLWANDQPDAAARWALTLPEDAEKEQALATVAEVKAGQEGGEATLVWLGQLDSPVNLWPAKEAAVRVLLEKGELISLPERWDSDPSAVATIALVAEHQDWQANLAWAEKLNEGVIREVVRDNAWFELGKQGVARNSHIVSMIEIADVEAFALGMIVGQGRTALQEWKETLPSGSAKRFQTTHAELVVLASLEPEAGYRLAKGWEGARAGRDRLFHTVIKRSYRRSAAWADKASSWLDEIHSPDLRESLRLEIEIVRRHGFQEGLALSKSDRRPFREQTLRTLRDRLAALSHLERVGESSQE